MAAEAPRWIVLKFGGTSVATLEGWRVIADQVRARIDEGMRPLVVVSALRPTSDDLEALIEKAIAGAHEEALAAIEARHLELAAAMGIDGETLLAPLFESLRRWVLGISLIRDANPRLRARVMAVGELLSSTLGAAWLQRQGIAAAFCDVRDHLVALEPHPANEARRYLSATAAADPDSALAAALQGLGAEAVITQGFIASDAAGDTVLLGRGGSDTSAAILAARLGAERLEIWTDVPGMFTANPRQVETARLLRHLDYAEAQEIATTGARVLHPRCLEPVRRRQIPVHVRCTSRPELEGTEISAARDDAGLLVKAISLRTGMTLVSMETLGMWQQVGFLAVVFDVFRRHGISIDSVATSDTNVTVTLDPGANALESATLDALVEELSAHCKARVLGPCAAISLVGHGIRSMLPRLAPALEAFEEQRLYLLTQAASDLNLTFVMDQEHAEVLVGRLHALLFGETVAGSLFGPTWAELEAPAEALQRSRPWWHERREDLLALARERSPLYVYDQSTVQVAVDRLLSLPVDRLFYAVKANWHPGILRLLERAGLGFECVSPGEIAHVRSLFPDLPGERILYTPNFAPAADYEAGFEAGARVTLDNLDPLRTWPQIFRGRSIFVRIDPGAGEGHHAKVRTAGTQSKFGVPLDELAELAALAAANDTRVIGLHAHVGSGIRTPTRWVDTATVLAAQAEAHFPEVRILDLGGGLGVVERPGQQPLDLEAVGSRLAAFRAAHPNYELWLEPGRYLVASAGVLLVRATQRKRKGDHTYVGVDAGMNALLRPALYGAYHEIANLDRLGERATWRADVVGPICETGDVLGHGRLLPPTEPGDVLLVATAGAYGRAMASSYNLRPPPEEVLLPPAPGVS